MASVNKVILVGNLGKDPEARFSNGATPMAIVNFTLACNGKVKGGDGKWEEKAEWVNCVAFGKTAELVTEYLHKGSQAYVEGRLQTRKWQDKEGKDRYTTEVVVNDVVFLGKKGSASPPTGEAAPQIGPEGDIPF